MKKKCLHPRYIEACIMKCIDCEHQFVTYKKWDWNHMDIIIGFPEDFDKKYEAYKKQLLMEDNIKGKLRDQSLHTIPSPLDK